MKAPPWYPNSPDAWAAETALKTCAIAARLFWREAIDLIWKAQAEGRLLINGFVPSVNDLAAAMAIPPDEVAAGIAELLAKGIADRDPDGALVSRKMRRDMAKRAADQANGRMGGNPDLIRIGGDAVARDEVRKANGRERQRRARERKKAAASAAQTPAAVTRDSVTCHASKRDSHAPCHVTERDIGRDITRDRHACHAAPPLSDKGFRGGNPPDKGGDKAKRIRDKRDITPPSALTPREATAALERAFGAEAGPPCHPMGGGPALRPEHPPDPQPPDKAETLRQRIATRAAARNASPAEPAQAA